jgi:hypothetical protein
MCMIHWKYENKSINLQGQIKSDVIFTKYYRNELK